MRVTVTSLEYVAQQFVNGHSLDRNDVERLYLNGRHLLNDEQYARLERLYRTHTGHPLRLRRRAGGPTQDRGVNQQ